MVVKEFRAVVTIKALHGKGEFLFNVQDLGQHALCAFVPSGAIFDPGSVNIRHGQRPDKATGQAVATMGHGIGFHEAGLGDIPEIGTDEDLVF